MGKKGSGEMNRKVSDRLIQQHEQKATKANAELEQAKRKKNNFTLIDEIQKELKRRPGKIRKCHEWFVKSNKYDSDNEDEVPDLIFSDWYKKLNKLPKSWIHDYFLKALVPDLDKEKQAYLNRMDLEFMHKFFFFTTMSKGKHTFGPYPYREFLDVYKGRADRCPDLVERLDLKNRKEVDWSKLGLYKLEAVKQDSEEMTDDDSAKFVTFYNVQVSTGRSAAMLKITDTIEENWSYSTAHVLVDGQKVRLRKFFNGKPEFKKLTKPYLPYERAMMSDDSSVERPKAKAKSRPKSKVVEAAEEDEEDKDESEEESEQDPESLPPPSAKAERLAAAMGSKD
mmetsp:Transcript_10173/g.22920  ORF Transcript_10173/g.22920 Transcript_10173/m.22920 type:complete len:339 (-) Transcript_10173:96-1112(-)